MIESLGKASPASIIYVLAFDDKCYEVLTDIAYKNVKLISMKEFESERMLAIKNSRSHRSYCWSCTPFLIKYIIENRGEDICTYIDADMLFYSNPDVLIDDIDKAKADVGIVEHRFGEGTIQEEQIRIAGRYCVEFNTFRNNENSLKILNWWADKCEECCTDDTSKSSDGLFGDQMYLTDWLDRFDNIYVMKNHGGGMAPWNVYRYRLIDNRKAEIELQQLAIRFFKSALDKSTIGNPDIIPVVTYLIGELYRRLEDRKAAREWFENTIESIIDPEQQWLLELTQKQAELNEYLIN